MATIDIKYGSTPGPDPWSISTIIFTSTQGKEVKAVLHMGSELYVDGKDQEIYGMDQDEQVADRFEELTGLPLYKARQIYDRLHPYFDDPYGCLADYE